jgi:hypothetical protein
MTELGQTVLTALDESGAQGALDCRAAQLSHAVKGFRLQLERDLEKQGLLTSSESRWDNVLRIAPVGLVLVSLAAYKLLVALAKGHTNILGLVVLCLGGLFVLYRVCGVERLTPGATNISNAWNPGLGCLACSTTEVRRATATSC